MWRLHGPDPAFHLPNRLVKRGARGHDAKRGGTVMLTLEGCRSRLARFREELDEQGVDLAVLSNYRNVYYLSGHLREVELPQFLVVEPKGKVVLITDTQPVQSAAEE